MANNDTPKAKRGHAFTIRTRPHIMRVTDDWSHHREIYVSTGDIDAYRKMLASVNVADTDDTDDAQ